MTELKGTLLRPPSASESHQTPERVNNVNEGLGVVALKGSLAPDNRIPEVLAEDISYNTIVNRDSGIVYRLINRVVKPDGRVTLQLEAMDGSGGTVTVPESRLIEALAAEGGAWSSDNRVE